MLINVLYLYSDNNNIKINKMRTLTLEQVKRIENELVNTKNLLAEEMKISADLRYNDVVENYENHILKLENILISKQW